MPKGPLLINGTQLFDGKRYTPQQLLAIHVTSCAAERNWSKWGWVYQSARRNRLGIEKAQKLVTIQAAHGKKHESGKDEMVVLEHMAASEDEAW